MKNRKLVAALLALSLTWPLAAAAQGLADRILWGTSYQERLAVLWVNNLANRTIVVGKTYMPRAMHRVTVAVSGQKAPGASKKDARMIAFGSPAEENRIEQLLVAGFPLTIRATFRVPERLPKQGRPAILEQPPADGASVLVFCSLTGEELAKCVAEDAEYLAVDRSTCERLASASDRLEPEDCAELPEVSPVADVLTLIRRDGDAEPGR